MSQTLKLETGCRRRRCPAFLSFLRCHPHQNGRSRLGKPGQDLPGGGCCLEVGVMRPGRSCSGSTPINAADGRWAPARPPPPAAQWARRSLGRTMRAPGRAPAAGLPGAARPGPCCPSRRAPQAALHVLGLRPPSRNQWAEGLHGGTQECGGHQRTAAHCSRPRGPACSIPALRPPSAGWGRSARSPQPHGRAPALHPGPARAPSRRRARTCLPLAQRLLQPVGPHILRVLRPAAVLPRRCHRSRAPRRRVGARARGQGGAGQPCVRVRRAPSALTRPAAPPGGPRCSAPPPPPTPRPPHPCEAGPRGCLSPSPRGPGGRGHQASAATSEARAPRPPAHARPRPCSRAPPSNRTEPLSRAQTSSRVASSAAEPEPSPSERHRLQLP